MFSDDRPIVFLSVFKSGTHLLRRIIEDLTGLPWNEPKITPGRVDYQNPDQLFHKPGHFYSWHLFPTEEVRRRLTAMRARPVLLMRNMYDLAVSMYYHFANNIDADIGRGRNVQHYFAAMSKEEGLHHIIEGMFRPDFRWPGIGSHLQHMEQMLTLAGEMPCLATTFERLTMAKEQEVRRLARFLDIALDRQQLETVIGESDFARMRQRALTEGRGSHFRQGQAGSHRLELNEKQRAMVREQMLRFAPRLPGLADLAGFPEICKGGMA